jgi:transposase
MAKRIRYSETYIKTAIERVNSGVTQAQVAKELGIHPQTLSKWCTKAKSRMTSEERSEAEEIIRLKKELAKAKAENEFLKKAAAFFAKSL